MPPHPLPIPPSSPYFLVLNAGSGAGHAEAAEAAVAQVLGEAGRQHEVIRVSSGTALVQAAAQAVQQARRHRGVVVAAGGDGTLNAVAQAVLPTGLPFGVLPRGTFNYFSRTHGIPADPVQAATLLVRSHAHPVQVGLVNDRVFLVNASLGMYPQLLEDREAYKRRFGRSRWVARLAGLAALLGQHRQMHVVLERGDQTLRARTPTLFVGNNRLQLGQLGLPEADAVETDGVLAALMLRPVGPLSMLGLAMRGALGQLGETDDVLRFTFRQLTVRPAMLRRWRAVKVATDGELLRLRPPLSFRVSPQPLMLLKPAFRPGETPPDPDA